MIFSCGLEFSNSCIIVCTVYGICTARGLHMYFRGRSPRKYMKVHESQEVHESLRAV